MRLGDTVKPVIVFCALGAFLAGAGVCFAAEAKGSGIEVFASVDRPSIRIGDKITYTITAKAAEDIEVEFPQILPENLAGFAVKDFGSSQKSLFGKKTFKQWYLLDTYASGEHMIPQAAVKYRAKGKSDWQELSAKEIKVEVKSLLDAASAKGDIRDIRGPRSLAGRIWPYALAALIAFLIIAAVFVFIILKKKKEEYSAPPVPAHLIAYEALACLQKKDYIRRGQAKAYYIELSDIARRYLENRFNIRAPEMTTEEFLTKIKEDSALSPEHKGLLRDFLTNCDLVKFARYQPQEAEADLSLDSAKRLIDQTKEQEAV